MTKTNPKLKASDILLIPFDQNDSSTNTVRKSLALLKELGHHGPYQFSNVGQNLLADAALTLKELLYQDTHHLSLMASTDEKQSDLWQNCHNKALIELLAHIIDLDCPIGHADAAQLKIIYLCQALLQKKSYLFVEAPEKHLNQTQLETFARALKFSAHENGQIAFIYSSNQSFWRHQATKMVEEQQGKQIEVVSLVQDKIQQKFLKPEFAQPLATESAGLTFHWPQNNHKKAA